MSYRVSVYIAAPEAVGQGLGNLLGFGDGQVQPGGFGLNSRAAASMHRHDGDRPEISMVERFGGFVQSR